MTFGDVLTFLGVALVPFIAGYVQWRLQLRNQLQQARMELFRILMATRASTVSEAHVMALNDIDLRFNGESNVQDAWKEYLGSLTLQIDPSNVDRALVDRRNELLVELLYEMSKSLGQKFSKPDLRSFYFPKAHVDMRTHEEIIRQGLVNLFLNKGRLPVSVFDYAQITREMLDAAGKAQSMTGESAAEGPSREAGRPEDR